MSTDNVVATSIAHDIRNSRVMLLACFITADIINPIMACDRQTYDYCIIHDKGMLTCVAPLHETSLRRPSKARMSRDFTVLPAPCISSACHTHLCLPSRSWYSFTDPGGMEG